MDTATVIVQASEYLKTLSGHEFDILTVEKPISEDAAVSLAKIISKLSPLVGNLIEFHVVEYLNESGIFSDFGSWRRQDPGFPDTVFDGVLPTPGFEIKAWFPLATEITARFKDSQNHFKDNNTHVAMLAWLPEHVIYGKPVVIGVCIVSALSVAEARDTHYHNPPDYLVIEPEDTKARTANLQQTNTAGYKFQGGRRQFENAQRIVEEWGAGAKNYQPTPEYQKKLRELLGRYTYRLDTNFAKMDRIVHAGIEEFKSFIHAKEYKGLTVGQWNRLLGKGTPEQIKRALEEHLNYEAD